MPSEFGIERDPPTGLIVMWAGQLSDIPTGWALCDGNNGTPNLLDRFLQSVPSATTNPGSTGGETTKTLSVSQLPSHTHNHDSNTSTDGAHQHTFDVDYNLNEGGSDEALNYGSGTTSSDHKTDSKGDHTHSDAVGSTGGTSSYDNRPTFFELAFIQKL